MKSLVGTGSLARFVLRRERVRLGVWVAILALVPVGTGAAFASLYPDEASREALAQTVALSPALTAFLGPLYSSSIGGLVVWRSATLSAFLVAVMAILTMIRHTRQEEETGRRELLGSTVMGRGAPLAAALLVTTAAGFALALLLVLGLVGIGLPFAGSLAFGLALAGTAFAFAGVGAFAAQLTESSGAATGIGVAIAGTAFGLRMIADANSDLGWIGWLSPIGWVSRIRAFAGEEWWVLSLWVVFGLVMIAVASAIAMRRDVGAGAFAPRPGPGRAGRGLAGPVGLSWRLQRGSFVSWLAGLTLLGALYGAMAESVRDMLEGNPQLVEIFELIGGEQGLIDAFFAAAVSIIALLASAYAIGAVLLLKTEEDDLRAEMVLATATSRSRWAWSHLVFGLGAPVLILAAAGAVAGVVYGLTIGDVGGQTGRVLAASLANLPAVWVLAAVAMALFGVLPRHTGLAWGALVFSLIVGQLGRVLQFPEWSINLSPFTHVPLPAEFEILPLLMLSAIAAALLAVGLSGLRKRDLGK